MEMKRMTIIIPAVIKRKINRACEDGEHTKNDIVNMALDEFFKPKPKQTKED